MVTLAKDFDVNDTFNDGFGLESRRAFLGESSGDMVHCLLHISRATLPIDIPARLLAEHRRSASSEIVASRLAPRPPKAEPVSRAASMEANFASPSR